MKPIALVMIPVAVWGLGCNAGPESESTNQRIVHDAALCPRTAPAVQHCVGPSTAAAFSLGVCGDFDANHPVRARVGRGAGAHVAVNGRTNVTSPMRIDGSLFAAGALTSTSSLRMDGELMAGADWIAGHPASVGGDATIVGTLDASHKVKIGGTLLAGDVIGDVDANVMTLGTASFALPLACDAIPRAADIIDAISTTDDEAIDRLPPHTLATIGAATDVRLGCGQYRVDSIGVDGALDIYVEGPTVLIVDGDFRVGAPTHIHFANNGSLDLVIAGSLYVDHPLDIGDGDPLATIAVGGDIRFAAPTHLTGALIAPDSAVIVDKPVTISGAAVFGALRVEAPFTVINDVGLTQAGCVAGN